MKNLSLIFLILSLAFGFNAQELSNFTDTRDGKSYKTVKIGNQVWMTEDLAFKVDSGCWAYDNDTGYVSKYGYLYDYETAQKVCPIGWHLPSYFEFETLLNNVGGYGNMAYNSLIPGGSSGFNGNFGGYRGSYDISESLGEYANLWSSSINNKLTAWDLDMIRDDAEATLNQNLRSLGFSVRCVQDN
jgi:uncharacterized protein (TIGR02145 family)